MPMDKDLVLPKADSRAVFAGDERSPYYVVS